jgi:hypothetical protein
MLCGGVHLMLMIGLSLMDEYWIFIESRYAAGSPARTIQQIFLED